MIQVVKYKCCESVFAACCEPECYTDSDWLKQLKKYVNRGDKVEMVEDFKFGKCRCNKTSKELDLFSSIIQTNNPTD